MPDAEDLIFSDEEANFSKAEAALGAADDAVLSAEAISLIASPEPLRVLILYITVSSLSKSARNPFKLPVYDAPPKRATAPDTAVIAAAAWNP